MRTSSVSSTKKTVLFPARSKKPAIGPTVPFGARPEAKYDIKLPQSCSGLTIETGGARYTFTKGAGCFDSIGFDVNQDGKIAADEILVSNAGSAFYVVDSKDRRGTLRGKKMSVELAGKRHTVIRIEGDYVTEDGKTNAAGAVYFHFYAG